MPRIRTIKPEALQHRKVGRLSIWARWLWLGTLTQADDEGRLVADPGQLRLLAFGYDDDMTTAKVSDLLAEIAATGLIVLYEVRGVPYAYFPSWAEHQRIDRPKPSKLPRPAGLRSTTHPRPVRDESTSVRRSIDGDQGSRIKEGIKDQGPDQGATLSGAGAPRRARPPGESLTPVDGGFEALWAAYPVKEGRGAALKAYRKIAPANGTADAIMAGLERWKASDRWARGYVAHLATWLNQRRWEDQPAAAQPMLTPKTQANVEALRRFARGATTGEGQP